MDEFHLFPPQASTSAHDVDLLWRELGRFPFFDDLAAVCVQRGTTISELRERRDSERLLRLLLTSRGLGLAGLPKGLIGFHSYPSGTRSAVKACCRPISPSASACLRQQAPIYGHRGPVGRQRVLV